MPDGAVHIAFHAQPDVMVGQTAFLQRLLAARPPGGSFTLAEICVVAASQRLADIARSADFQRVTVATSASPSALLQAAASAFA